MQEAVREAETLDTRDERLEILQVAVRIQFLEGLDGELEEGVCGR
jgi:hypothetical protein